MFIINQMVENLYSYKISYHPNDVESYSTKIPIFDQNYDFSWELVCRSLDEKKL